MPTEKRGSTSQDISGKVIGEATASIQKVTDGITCYRHSLVIPGAVFVTACISIRPQ